jgi:hypothetical protein
MGSSWKDIMLDSGVSSSFASVSEQCSKLALGVNISQTTMFDNYTLVQVNMLPLVVSMLALPECNLQLLTNALPELSRVLEGVRQSVAAQQSALHSTALER